MGNGPFGGDGRSGAQARDRLREASGAAREGAIDGDDTDGTHAPVENRDYVLLWCGQTVNVIGTQVSQLAYPLLVLALTGSPAQAGFVAAARTVPYLLFSLPAGVALLTTANRHGRHAPARTGQTA